MSTALIFGKAAVGLNDYVLADAKTFPTFTDYIEAWSSLDTDMAHSEYTYWLLDTSERDHIIIARPEITLMHANAEKLTPAFFNKFIFQHWQIGNLKEILSTEKTRYIHVPKDSTLWYVAVYGNPYRKGIAHRTYESITKMILKGD